MKKLELSRFDDGIGKDISSKEIKCISFLATGSEIINGDIQESNCHAFAKLINKNGGHIYQHLHVSDQKNDIISAIKYLLAHSDALIITGGLGPTSDDNTRFAVSDYIQKDLYFDEDVWLNIVRRLETFHLPAVESNRQQALFPPGSTLYPNSNGTACGFYVNCEEKLIFVLPGPPKECQPLFFQHVLPMLSTENFFNKKSVFHWITLGLIESEIATDIDILSKPYHAQTAYRWHYPYLEIKLTFSDQKIANELIQKIDLLLKPNLVSQEHKNAFQMFEDASRALHTDIHIFDDCTCGMLANEIHHTKLRFISNKDLENIDRIFFVFESSQKLNLNAEYSGTITFSCNGIIENTTKYSHQISVPYHGKEIFNFAKHYMFWQLAKFVESALSEKAI